VDAKCGFPPLGSKQCSPNPLAGFKEAISRREKDREKERKKGERKARKGTKGTGENTPPRKKIRVYGLATDVVKYMRFYPTAIRQCRRQKNT